MSEPPRPPAPPAPPPPAAPPPGQPAPAAEPEPPPPPHPLIARLGEIVVADETDHGQLAVRIEAARLVEAARILRDDPNLKFEHLSDVTAVDYVQYDPAGGPPGQARTPRFDVVYHLYSISRNNRVRVKVGVEESAPTLPSLTDVWAAANWAERETYDMYGIEFSGHPNMTRILMPDDWQGHPLRKDYPLIEEEIEFTSTLERLNERRS